MQGKYVEYLQQAYLMISLLIPNTVCIPFFQSIVSYWALY